MRMQNTAPSIERLSIEIDAETRVSAAWCRPNAAVAVLVLAHGAGAGMDHVFMTETAQALGARDIATLRFNFPFIENGSKRPDRPAFAQACVRAAVGAARARARHLPLFAGGKSFGGRMTSQAQAQDPLIGVHGLVFLGFPLHPSGRPSITRADHLRDIRIPMLFVQGTRDALADLALLAPIVARIEGAEMAVIEDADHAFHVRKTVTGRTDAQTRADIADHVAAWCATTGLPTPT